jgi:hypothetical protein
MAILTKNEWKATASLGLSFDKREKDIGGHKSIFQGKDEDKGGGLKKNNDGSEKTGNELNL